MDHRNTIDELRTQIAEGRYEVDARLVADAIIRHCSSQVVTNRSELRHADRSRRPRLISLRRIPHRRSRSTPKTLAA